MDKTNKDFLNEEFSSQIPLFKGNIEETICDNSNLDSQMNKLRSDPMF